MDRRGPMHQLPVDQQQFTLSNRQTLVRPRCAERRYVQCITVVVAQNREQPFGTTVAWGHVRVRVLVLRIFRTKLFGFA